MTRPAKWSDRAYPTTHQTKGQSSVLQAIDHTAGGSMTAQLPGSCPSALRITTHSQQVAPLWGPYLSAEVQSMYSTAQTDRVTHSQEPDDQMQFSIIHRTPFFEGCPCNGYSKSHWQGEKPIFNVKLGVP